MKRTLILIFSLVVACAQDEASGGPTNEGSTSSDATSPSSTDTPPDEPPRADLGVSPPSVCEDRCVSASSCQGIAMTDCLLQCTGELDAALEASASCGSEHEALLSCLGTLSCEELGDHDAGEEGPCRSQQQTASLACASPEGEPPAVCADFCDALDVCGLSDAAACQAACVESQAGAAASGSACLAAQDQQLTCVAALECDALQAWMSSEDTSACPSDLDQACSGDPE